MDLKKEGGIERPTPAKPTSIIRLEGRSHRTKAELRAREKSEKSLLTGVTLKETKEVKENEVAHKEFQRIIKLLKKIEKNDDLYGAVINRYCILYAETKGFEEKRERMYSQLCEFQEKMQGMIDRGEMAAREAYNIELSMQKNIVALDRQVQAKRKMLADIEKENIMTIASALRTIPKKQEKKTNALMEALSG